MASLRTGGEIDAMCTKCKMVLAHTILAMEGGKPARVQCNTCHGQHNYRSAGGEVRVSAPRAPREPGAAKASSHARVSFDEQLATKSSVTRPYSPKTTYSVDDTVSHPTFGTGFVAAVRADKIDVTFRSGTRTLIHGRH